MTDRRHLGLMLLVAGTAFMEILDGTILATAGPSMARSFGVTSNSISVAITAYLLTLAVLIPLSGWLTERFGVRRVFLVAIAIFTIASAACAFSTSLPELTGIRVVQGVGGAMMVPVGRLTVLRSTGKADLIRAIAWLTWPALVAPIAAPFVGGLITTYATWPWVFLINVPLGVVAFVAALSLVPRQPRGQVPALDWVGFILLAIGLGALTYLGSLLSAQQTDVVAVIISAVVGVGVTGAAIVHLLRARIPLLDLRVLRIETFRITHAGGSLFRLTIAAVPFLLPLFFQDALGWTPLEAGSVVLVLFVGNLAIKPATTPLLIRFGFRTVLIWSTAGAVVSMALTALVSGATPIALLIVLMFFSGVTRSLGFTAYNTIAFADIPGDRKTSANTLASTVQQVASGLGVAVGAVALRAAQPISGLWGAKDAVTDFHVAFVIIAVLALIAFVEALLVSRTAGDSVRPARPSRQRSAI
jgi:EmrB/QacA subfamily drug resistance transporter